ncbi:MAG: hypothetical protein JO042_05270 [Sinobacteraceae bacterium]|nr:hypothetical protein [Nevskiaceae bacterium]
MSTFNTRKLLLAPLVAAFAISAQVGYAADTAGDTQSQVRSVLLGTHTYRNLDAAKVSAASARVTDIQENARQVLLGERKSDLGGNRYSVASGADSPIGSNGHSSREARELTQRVVLGRVAS